LFLHNKYCLVICLVFSRKVKELFPSYCSLLTARNKPDLYILFLSILHINYLTNYLTDYPSDFPYIPGLFLVIKTLQRFTWILCCFLVHPTMRFVLQDQNIPPSSLVGSLSSARMHLVLGYLVITRISPLSSSTCPYSADFCLSPLPFLWKPFQLGEVVTVVVSATIVFQLPPQKLPAFSKKKN